MSSNAMSTDQFAVFSHVPFDAGKFFNDPRQPETLVQQILWCCRKIAATPGWTGTFVLFLDTNWQLLFEELRDTTNFDMSDWKRQSHNLRMRLGAELKDSACRVRLFMADDMERLLDLAPMPSCGTLRSRLLAGSSLKSLYDVPKLVKWLLQIANPAIPVATFDWDVLTLGWDTSDDAVVGQFGSNAERLLNQVRTEAQTGRSFVMSGQYLSSHRQSMLMGQNPIWPGWELDATNGSATRTIFLSRRDPQSTTLAMNLEAVRAFFSSLNELELAPAFGANISGAGQVMWGESLLDYPPLMLHARQQAVWCDDFLLRRFHIARDLVLEASFCAAPDAVFDKPRVLDSNGLNEGHSQWHRDHYFGGLLLGAVICDLARKNDVSRLDKGTLDASDLWDRARTLLHHVVAAWTRPAYDGTELATYMTEASSWSLAPEGLRKAVASLPREYPNRANLPSCQSPLSQTLVRLIEDLRLIPNANAYWRELTSAFQKSPEISHWVI